MDKEDVEHIYHGVVSSHSKEGTIAIDRNMDELGGYYAEVK